jgi:adenylate kinase
MISCPPPADNICPKCGAEIITRKDDLPETIKHRLDVYHEQTEPLKGFYGDEGKLAVVNGENGIEETTRLALEALGV